MVNVLVLGGGVGGIVASTVLKKILGSEANVLVVDRRDQHHYASSFPLLMVGKREPSDITRSLNRLRRKKIELLTAEVQELNPGRHEVVTNLGKLSYDALIVSLGVNYHPETVPGFNQYAFNVYELDGVVRVRQKLARFNGGRVVLFISSLPYKCPPAPYEMMFLLDEYFRRQGLRDRVELTLVTPEPGPESLAGPLVGQSVRQMMAARGIELVTGAKILKLDPGVLVLDHGMEIRGDLFCGIAPHWGPDVLRRTDLVDRAGWVRVDPHSLQTIYPRVWAIGDATAIRLPVLGMYAPKAGVFAHYQAEVVARNLARLVRGQKPGFRYTGKGV